MRNHAIFTLSVIGVIACAVTGPALAQDKAIKIGALLPISGPGAYFGVQKARRGACARADQQNGRQWLQVHDPIRRLGLCAAAGHQAAKRLIEQFKPDVVIGEECSDATLAIMPTMAQAKIPLLNAGSSSIKITDPGNPWTFRIMPNEVMQGVDIRHQRLQQAQCRTAVLLNENTNAGIGNAKVFNDTFTKLGGKILAEIAFGRDINDFTAIATRVAGLGKIDVIPTYTLEGQGLKITQALAQAGVTKGGGGGSIQLGTIWLPFVSSRGRPARRRLYSDRAIRSDRPARRRSQLRSSVQEKYKADPTHLQRPATSD